jgi:hypothetical protein
MRRRALGTCEANECQRPAVARGLCGMHWKRWRLHGDVNFKRARVGFWDRVKISAKNECWLWTGSRRGNKPLEYGVAWFHGKAVGAHRVAWILTNGPIPTVEGAGNLGVFVLHKCDVPLCCNPEHLYLGSHKQNMRDAAVRERSVRFKKYCRHGHPRSPENLYVSKQGLRTCRICHRLKEAQRRSRIRGHKEQRAF